MSYFTMSYQELRLIIGREWYKANTAQRLALAKKMYELRPSINNEKALKTAQLNYDKGKPTPTYILSFS